MCRELLGMAQAIICDVLVKAVCPESLGMARAIISDIPVRAQVSGIALRTFLRAVPAIRSALGQDALFVGPFVWP